MGGSGVVSIEPATEPVPVVEVSTGMREDHFPAAGRTVTGVEDRSRTSVLLVDNDRDLRRALALYLRLEGCDVVSAADSRTAIREIKRDPPDAVIAEISLPDRDGLALCRKLKNGNGRLAIPVIIFTGFTGASWRQGAIDSGADEYVTKPCSFDRLLEAVRRLVSARERPG
ncbi:MAG: response regulator [Actinobacteria bacterium]|nr:response regulator [Actinomycetota bacterium]MBU1944432.1 response regulator [Actinomycetota bacterium]MBU2688218.1 response regulator [Actinomycetota bacterium]